MVEIWVPIASNDTGAEMNVELVRVQVGLSRDFEADNVTGRKITTVFWGHLDMRPPRHHAESLLIAVTRLDGGYRLQGL